MSDAGSRIDVLSEKTWYTNSVVRTLKCTWCKFDDKKWQMQWLSCPASPCMMWSNFEHPTCWKDKTLESLRLQQEWLLYDSLYLRTKYLTWVSKKSVAILIDMKTIFFSFYFVFCCSFVLRGFVSYCFLF